MAWALGIDLSAARQKASLKYVNRSTVEQLKGFIVGPRWFSDGTFVEAGMTAGTLAKVPWLLAHIVRLVSFEANGRAP